ncbi:Guanylate kinase [Leptospirillum ferriphilum]|uniref:Guanylate kinase n=3 Tax=Leptospirillum TaxID=179 RepID=A0A094W6H8_9BACT|nr:Guanylate kinase [Leptospirillum ferriphilum]
MIRTEIRIEPSKILHPCKREAVSKTDGVSSMTVPGGKPMRSPDPAPSPTIYGKRLYTPLLFVVSAPSGAGKTSLCKEIARKSSWIHYSVSYTTRSPRPGEKNGIDYTFVTKDQFQEMQANNHFIESAEVYGNFYGTSLRTIEDSFAKGLDVLVDIDIQGAQKIRQSGIDNTSIYILPPSYAVLQERLSLRGQDSLETVRKRLERVRQEIYAYQEYDYLIFNVDFQQAVNDLQSIIVSEHLRRQRLSSFVKDHFIEHFSGETIKSHPFSLREAP